MKITEQQVAAACEIAKQVFDGHMKQAQGVAVLSREHGINQASAGDFINDYRCLVRGKLFQRAMSATAMRYFLESIFADRDLAAKENALIALQAHIAYYEGHYKTRMYAMRGVVDEFDARAKRART